MGNMGLVCHFLGLRKEKVVLIYPTWSNNRSHGRIKVRNLLLAMERKLGKLKQKKRHVRPREWQTQSRQSKREHKFPLENATRGKTKTGTRKIDKIKKK